jgi:hypothetical protein
MNARLTTCALLAAGLLSAGCVTNDSLGAPPSRANISVRFSGDPLNTVQNGGADAGQYPRAVQFDLIVSEANGVGANMIGQSLVTSPDSGAIKAVGAAPSATIPAGGSLVIPMTLMFSKFPGGGLTLALTVNAIDVAGNIVTGIGTVRVN